MANPVGEAARGLGVGRGLVHALERFFTESGAALEYEVVTDAEDPRSNAFYEGIGFSHRRRFVHHGHPMNAYHKRLTREACAR